jgi:hyperosmotically inducible protein
MKLKEKAYQGAALYLVLALVLMSVAACKTPAGRTSGQVVDDATITTKVKAKIADENVMRGIAVSVETFEGNVTLTGAVETPQQKERAEEIAKSVDGVRAVNNLLMIRSS